MKNFVLKNYAFSTLVAGIAIITTIWSFELYEGKYSFEEVITVLSLMLIALVSILFLALSFSALIRLPQDKSTRKTPNKSILWFYILIETVIFFTVSYLLNSLTLFLMPLIFLVLALYPISRYTTFLSQFIFGLGFASVPVYIWSAIWGKFYTISSEFTFQPFVLGMVIWFWAAAINIRHGIISGAGSEYRKTIYSIFGLSAARLAINFSISIILGLLFFLTVINGHTFIIWIGLTATVVIFLCISSKLQKSNEDTSAENFNKLSLLAISAFTFFQVVDVVIEVFFIPY